MTKHKKPKTGDVVGWVVIDRDGEICEKCYSRAYARLLLMDANKYSRHYRIAKIILAK